MVICRATLMKLTNSNGLHQAPLTSLSQPISPFHGRFSGGVVHPANSGIWKNFRFTYSSTTRVAGILQSNVGVLLNKNAYNGIRNFSAAGDLSSKKCVPCSSKELRPMTQEAANTLMPQVPGWNFVNEDGVLKLQRSWKVKNFLKGLEFFQLVAGVAEAEGHHPDLHLVGWNNVKMDVWTHSQGGLTENDFILAAKIDRLDAQHLLSKKVAK